MSQDEKTLVFCATQDHARAVRDLLNQMKASKDPNYCQRVTANDGARGEQHLRDFQDNEKSVRTILTTSQKVGVEELDREKLSPLLKLKYHNAIADAWAG